MSCLTVSYTIWYVIYWKDKFESNCLPVNSEKVILVKGVSTLHKQKRYSMDIVAYFFKCQMKLQLHMVSVAINFWQLNIIYRHNTHERAYEELSNNAFLLQLHVSLVP